LYGVGRYHRGALLAHQRGEGLGIESVAAQNAMSPKQPQIPELADRWRLRNLGYIACDKYYQDVTNISTIVTQSHNILGATRIARLGRAAVSDGIERECGEPLAVKQTASSFCEICRAPRCANGDVKSFVFGGLGAVRTRLVFPDPMEGFPDERI
jgi:hypothetical protein